MKIISEIGGPSNQLTADSSMDSILYLAKRRTKKLLTNLVKYPKSRPDYLDFKNEFEKFYDVIMFIYENNSFKNKGIIVKVEGYQIFKRHFKVYERAIGPDQSNQLKKLCEIAEDHLNIRIKQEFIDQIDNELSFDEDNLPF